ncbi:KAP family NTPase [Patescibacteria group bacterium]|nr:KAP family NTPase [Patescibacteria group bacterium]MBU1683265.1 KAP family NTPase [Patescibacteria group bacterium]
MYIKLPLLDIKPEAPFENDALKRKESSDFLTQFISKLEEPYVIAVDSCWGSGKSTFLKMWRYSLLQNGFFTIQFNAWETDFKDDALVALIKEIEIGLNGFNINSKQKDKTRKLLKKVKENAYKLAKKAIPAFVKIATQGVIDLNQGTEETLSSIAEDLVKEQFDEYEKTKESLANFKTSLEEFATELKSDNKGPLIFIIDELDRCRPDYAIQVLERAKHLFSINNIVFVLGIDMKQIGHSIKSVYGQGMDVRGYLDRFIDLDYHLPEPDIETFVRATLKRHQLDQWFSERKKQSEFHDDYPTMEQVLIQWFSELNLSLRTIEQIISQIIIVLYTTAENQHFFPGLLCFLSILRKIDIDTYNKIREKSMAPENVLKNIQKHTHSNFLDDNHYGAWITAHLEIGMTFKKRQAKRYDPIGKYSKTYESEKSSSEEKDRAKLIIDIIRSIGNNHYRLDVVDFLIKKIEISSQFK